MADLSLLLQQEAFRLQDFIYGAAKNTQVDRASGQRENPLHLTDTVTVARTLEVSLQETVLCADCPVGRFAWTQGDLVTDMRDVVPADVTTVRMLDAAGVQTGVVVTGTWSSWTKGGTQHG